ncbi:Xaa-Pro aminopeptidase [Lihuaxuella thermophila]|uniref:Xaa-Pro aminopeptidase n=2 Tax=Lihuaxuella thermophila TaxID=1173111 RepID=A0A1H8EW48_9BACL|nr:Xaa-Pro aminopeptidase [Lihuaxuella thermophila]
MEQRIARLRKQMHDRGIRAMLVSHPVNRRYITGFTGSAGLALITAEEAVLVTDFRYLTQVKEQAPHLSVSEHKGQIFGAVAEACRKLGIQSLAFEQDHLTYAQHKQLEEALDGIPTQPVSGLVEQLRMIKDEEELAIIRQAARIADQTFEQIVKEIQPGMRETEIAMRLEFIIREMGASSSSFDIIVASGKRSALPHGTASDKRLEKGDLVTLDFGAYYKGYASDITRTIVLGKPSEKQKEIYDIVLEAGKLAISAIRPGITGREADAAARDYIARHGYGGYFGHGTGHGLGLEVHEAPRLSPQGDTPLAPGMVVTVEPGIYLPDFGGVRIEDDVLVTEAGGEVLTHCTKELIIID